MTQRLRAARLNYTAVTTIDPAASEIKMVVIVVWFSRLMHASDERTLYQSWLSISIAAD
jgi:hypothetical protein